MSLCAQGLGKRFPGVVALKDVSLEVQPGRILALVGANGAGKSTLIKILTGFYDEYEGTIEIDGQPVDIRKPAEAQALGIEVVHQEVDTVLIPYLTVSENLLIEQLAHGGGGPLVNWRAMHRETKAALDRIGLKVDPRARVEDLVLHEKQMLVIARAISHRVRYLIFDEPTTSLGPQQVDRLFEVIRALKADGVGIIYISHRLNEVLTLADDVMVLRNGERVAQFARDACDIGAITRAMLGTSMSEAFPPRPQRTPGEVVLEARGLTRAPALNDVSLQVRKGEIVGIAGLVGAGKTELLRALFGADPVDSGEFLVDGRPLKLTSPDRAVQHGIYLVPEERRSQGVLVQDSIRKNVSLPFLGQFAHAALWMSRALELAHARSIIEQVGVVPARPETLVQNLSGGNQQKVAIGKWFGRPARVMMFDEATQGIDVKAKRDIYELVHRLSEDAGVIYASADIDETLALADRILVMRDGRIVAELSAAEADRQLVMEYATGARQEMPPREAPHQEPVLQGQGAHAL